MQVMQVDAYEQGRPGYPLEAVQYAVRQLNLDVGHKKVVDLAAGTGKLTRCALLQVVTAHTSDIVGLLSAFVLHDLQSPRRLTVLLPECDSNALSMTCH